MQVTIRPMNENDDIERITDWFESIGPEWLLDYEFAPAARAEAREQLLTWMRGADGRSCVLVARCRKASVNPSELTSAGTRPLAIDRARSKARWIPWTSLSAFSASASPRSER